MPRGTRPSNGEWRALYEAATAFKALAPWRWVREHHLFAVVDPEGRETGYCGVTGAEAVHMSLIVNLGMEGLAGYLTTLALGDEADPLELLFIQRSLMASFEDREMLTKEDRDVIKGLGLSFRGRGAWPLFRSFRPGFAPWHLTSWEARFLTAALEQSIDVARRAEDDPGLLDVGRQGALLHRVPAVDGNNTVWKDERRPVPKAGRPTIPVPSLDAGRARTRLARAKRLGSAWEVDMFHLPRPTHDRKGERPFYPRVALWVDHGTGLIMGHSMFGPTDVPDMSMATLRVIDRVGAPRTILVQRPEVAALLKPLADLGGMDLRAMECLEGLEEARMSMLLGIP